MRTCTRERRCEAEFGRGAACVVYDCVCGGVTGGTARAVNCADPDESSQARAALDPPAVAGEIGLLVPWREVDHVRCRQPATYDRAEKSPRSSASSEMSGQPGTSRSRLGEFMFIPVETMPPVVPVWKIDFPNKDAAGDSFTEDGTASLALIRMLRSMAELTKRCVGS